MDMESLRKRHNFLKKNVTKDFFNENKKSNIFIQIVCKITAFRQQKNGKFMDIMRENIH